jgi:hypothetical protein
MKINNERKGQVLPLPKRKKQDLPLALQVTTLFQAV